MIQLKRISEPPSPLDGYRVLVERFWPRDWNAKHAKLDLWLNEVAPSVELHKAFGELKDKHRSIKMLRKRSAEGTVTSVHAAPHSDVNAALTLKAFLEQTSGTSEE